MRKTLLLISMLLIASMVLMACGAEDETTTALPGTQIVATDEGLMTEAPMATDTVEPGLGQATEEGIPVTGAGQPFLLENELDYDVWNGNNDQIGEVDNMVIDLANSQISYAVISTGGFLDIGDTQSLVPWNALQLAINADADILSADDNVFILQVNQDLLNNAPRFDQNAFPGVGQPADDWYAGFNDYWGNAGVDLGMTNDTAANDLQGVILATDLLDSTVRFDPNADLSGLDDVDDEMDIDNAVVDTSTGKIQFLVINTLFGDEAHLTPVPLNHFRWDTDNESFIFNDDPGRLQSAPFFSGDLNNSDTFTDGWQNDYFNYWQ